MALIELDKRGSIAWITLNRPQALNSFTQAMWQELEEVWADFLADDALRNRHRVRWGILAAEVCEDRGTGLLIWRYRGHSV